MDAFTTEHLRRWAENHFLDYDEALDAVETITEFVREHPDVIELPRGASWPEVWSLVERSRS